MNGNSHRYMEIYKKANPLSYKGIAFFLLLYRLRLPSDGGTTRTTLVPRITATLKLDPSAPAQ